MKAVRIITVVGLLGALALALVLAGCGGQTSVTMRSGKVYYHQNKDYPKAEEWFKKAVAEDPSNWEAYFYLAMSQAQQGKYAEAGKAFDTAYGLAPDDKTKEVVTGNQQGFFAEHFKAGLSAKDTNNLAEAAKEFEMAVAVDPKESSGYINLAYCYREMGNKEKALEVMQRSVEIDSSSVYAWSNLGAAYRDLKDNDRAAEAFQKVVDLAPTDPEVKFGALASLGDIMFDRKEYNKALEYYTSAAEITTEDAALQYQIGAAHYQLGQYQEGIGGFKKCAALVKDTDAALYADAMFNLGVCYLKVKNYDEAIGTLQTLLQTQETAETHEMLGSAYGEKGLKEQAIEEFKKAKELSGK
jgi:tetratricopeptide (TPR) repeat protein